jgi:hypothetical protein
VLGFFSSRPNWTGECVPPGSGEGTHSLGDRGIGGPNSEEGTDTVVLEVYMYFVEISNLKEVLFSSSVPFELFFSFMFPSNSR